MLIPYGFSPWLNIQSIHFVLYFKLNVTFLSQKKKKMPYDNMKKLICFLYVFFSEDKRFLIVTSAYI